MPRRGFGDYVRMVDLQDNDVPAVVYASADLMRNVPLILVIGEHCRSLSIAIAGPSFGN